MMRAPSRRCLVTLLLALSAAAFAQSAEQEAGDTSEINRGDRGPLRERIPPVSGHLFLKKGRFELSPSVTFSLRDAFFSKYIFGAALTYHLSDAFAVGLRGGYALATVSSSAQLCDSTGCRPPSFSRVDGFAPGQITLLAGLDGQWAPIYGKLSIIAERFLHFDIYGIAGIALVQYGGPKPLDSNNLPDSSQPTPRLFTPGGNLGAGMRVFLNRWLTARLELRDLIYVERINVAQNASTSLRNQLLFELGVSMFFPTSFGEL